MSEALESLGQTAAPVISDSMPVISFNAGLSASFKHLEINYGQFAKGLADLGADAAVTQDMAIHFTDLGNVNLHGVHHGGSKMANRLAALPIIKREVRSSGVQEHQSSYMHQVVINMHGAKPTQKNLREVLGERFSFASTSKMMRLLDVGDCVSLILAHEIAHGLPENSGLMIFASKDSLNLVEDRIDSYMANCIWRREGNPWKGVVQLETK